MAMSAVQVWNPDDWELFSLNLLQHRHGALNVHKIPAAHQGDFGIDFYCTKEAVAYQCYAVEEPIDISTRADRQKTKITRDLAKIVANEMEIKSYLTTLGSNTGFFFRLCMTAKKSTSIAQRRPRICAISNVAC